MCWVYREPFCICVGTMVDSRESDWDDGFGPVLKDMEQDFTYIAVNNTTNTHAKTC